MSIHNLTGLWTVSGTDENGMATSGQPIVIFGAGGLGRMVLDILSLRPEWQPMAFLDSNRDKHHQTLDGLPIMGDLTAWTRLHAQGVRHATVAIGDNEQRIQVAEQLQAAGATLTSAIHPLAMIATTARIGQHALIGARVTVCVHATVGEHCVLSPGCIVEHDNTLADGVFVAPAARFAGGVQIGSHARIGIGATVIPGRKIGAYAEVAPGSVVIRDVADGARVTGVPARIAAPSRFEADPLAPLPEPAPEELPIN